MPNQWDQRQMKEWSRIALDEVWYTDPNDARRFAERICRLKQAFNAKPDIVIHLPDHRAVCVEVKVASGEASYSLSDKSDEGTKTASSMKQTDLQRYVLETLLGYQTHFVFLTPEGSPTSHPTARATPRVPITENDGARIQTLAWKQVLERPQADMSTPTELNFVRRMLESPLLSPKKRGAKA